MWHSLMFQWQGEKDSLVSLDARWWSNISVFMIVSESWRDSLFCYMIAPAPSWLWMRLASNSFLRKAEPWKQFHQARQLYSSTSKGQHIKQDTAGGRQSTLIWCCHVPAVGDGRKRQMDGSLSGQPSQTYLPPATPLSNVAVKRAANLAVHVWRLHWNALLFVHAKETVRTDW